MAFICYAGLQFGKGLVGEAHLCSMKKELRQPAWNCRISFQDGSLTPRAAWCRPPPGPARDCIRADGWALE